MATPDANALAQLDKLLAAIKALPDPRRAATEWRQAYTLLKKTTAAGNHLDNVIGGRDVAGLTQIVDQLRAPEASAAPAGPVIDEAVLKAAMKAFRRRLKFDQLDEDSKIDPRDPTSKGAAKVTALEPPREWGHEVWDELARRGAIKRVGRGLYEMAADFF